MIAKCILFLFLFGSVMFISGLLLGKVVSSQECSKSLKYCVDNAMNDKSLIVNPIEYRLKEMKGFYKKKTIEQP